MNSKRMERLANFGQSLWLDYIDRPLLESGKLKTLIDDGLRGMTSNPTIFNNAIGKTNDYDALIQKLGAEGKSTFEIYDELTVRDIQQACDAFAGVYEKTNRLDGYVSLEINPLIANKVEEQVKEGKRLFAKVNRPNVMIKVPATDSGVRVIEELTAAGINVNATLIFSVEQYQKTARAYLRGLSRNFGDISRIHSVASVFISRIDTAIDKILEEKSQEESYRSKYAELKGTAAVANARVIYQEFYKIFSKGWGFKILKLRGANFQRPLWASTGTKNPAYSELKYVQELITNHTVNTMPEPTLNAYIKSGQAIDEFIGYYDRSQQRLAKLAEAGVNLDAICADLLKQGVKSFEESFESLFKSIEQKSQTLSKR